MVCVCLATHVSGRAVLKAGGEEEDLRNANRNERSRGRSLLHGHGTFSAFWQNYGIRLAVGGWRLAVGGWRLVVPGACP